MSRKVLQPVAYFGELVEFSDRDWKALETDGDIKLSPHHRERLREAVISYREHALLHANGVRPGKIEHILAAIAKACRDLATRLGRQDEISAAAIREIRRTAAFAGRFAPDARAFWEEVTLWCECANAAASKLPNDSRGRSEPSLGIFLVTVCDVFSAAGGKGIYTESSLNFLVAACKKAGARIQSRAALVQRLKEARKAPVAKSRGSRELNTMRR